ncbi:MAG: penicillin-binding protein 2 [Alcaligenaceae bacterium]|nr:penicillin-binding protein 2 [Alcaligenaceae bacterium]
MFKFGKKKSSDQARQGRPAGYSRHFSSPVLHVQIPRWRSRLLFLIISCCFVAVISKALIVQVLNTEFLQAEGEKRFERTLVLPAKRGSIFDRNGEPLASSVNAYAVWVVPEKADTNASPEQKKKLAEILQMPLKDLQARLKEHDKTFVYLKRQISVAQQSAIKELKLEGVHFLPESKRNYPQGSLMAHVVGFTNIEDKGIEGVELQLNEGLSGTPGLRRVLRDRLGQIIADVQEVEQPVNGKDVTLTIDRTIQHLTVQALEKAMKKHQADSAAALVIDTNSGEILSMVSLPSYDPNEQSQRKGPALRNRGITDTFEPGSIIKPLVVGLALDAGSITKNTLFNTGSGSYRYQGATITDVSTRNGTLNAAGILRRSSNIGMAMISERLRAQQMWTVFNALGFGQAPNTNFPGAASGRVRPWERWKLIEKATMSYGYGLSVSLLQIAQAYTTFARDGDMISLSLIKQAKQPTSIQIFKSKIARDVRAMLEESSGREGNKIQAMVEGYRIGGKSGTARQIVNGRYSRSAYRGSFVSIAPISKPRIVVAVTIDRPQKGGYYGTVVAGPVAAEIIEGTLKHLAVPPDAPIESSLEAKNQNNSSRRNQG